jgi:hypothetical protein
MGKDDLAHCWRLLGGLLSIQPNLEADDSWFQTPIAQGNSIEIKTKLCFDLFLFRFNQTFSFQLCY